MRARSSQRHSSRIVKHSAASASKQGSSAAVPSTLDKQNKMGEPQFVVLQPERSIRRFYGTGNSGLADEFATEIERFWAVYPNQNDAWKLDIIYSNIGPVVKAELEVHVEIKGKPKLVLDKIREVFGERRSTQRLMQLFYSTQQRPGERIRDFSHRALAAFKTLTSRQEALGLHAMESSLLKEHFIESLNDRVLICTLRDKLREKPDMPFRDIRDRAIQWCGEEGGEDSTQTVASTVVGDPVVAERLAKLESMVAALTSKLDETCKKTLQQSQPAPKTGKRDLRCFKCNKVGHFKVNCPGNDAPLL